MSNRVEGASDWVREWEDASALMSKSSADECMKGADECMSVWEWRHANDWECKHEG